MPVNRGLPQRDKATFAIFTIMLLVVMAEIYYLNRKVEAIDRKLDKALNPK